jgi:hypothetical protein
LCICAYAASVSAMFPSKLTAGPWCRRMICTHASRSMSASSSSRVYTAHVSRLSWMLTAADMVPNCAPAYLSWNKEPSVTKPAHLDLHLPTHPTQVIADCVGGQAKANASPVTGARCAGSPARYRQERASTITHTSVYSTAYRSRKGRFAIRQNQTTTFTCNTV